MSSFAATVPWGLQHILTRLLVFYPSCHGWSGPNTDGTLNGHQSECDPDHHDHAQLLIETIWEEVLNVGVCLGTDNFFELGGTSIEAVAFTKLLKVHGVVLPLRDLFTNPTPAQLTPLIAHKVEAIYRAAGAEGPLLHANRMSQSSAEVSRRASLRRQSIAPRRASLRRQSIAPARRASGKPRLSTGSELSNVLRATRRVSLAVESLALRELSSFASSTSSASSAAGVFYRSWALGFGQVIGLLALAYVWFAPAFLVVRLLFWALDQGLSIPAAVACVPLAWIVYTVLLLSLSIVVQLLLVGRELPPGGTPVNTVFFLRWWLSQRMHGLVQTTVLRGPFIEIGVAHLYFRLLGAKIGKNVVLQTAALSDPSLITIGDDAVLERQCSIVAATIEGDRLVLAKVQLGRQVRLEFRSTVTLGATIGDGAMLSACSSTLPGAVLEPLTEYNGVTANPERRCPGPVSPNISQTAARTTFGFVTKMVGMYASLILSAISGAVAFHAALKAIEDLFGTLPDFDDGYAATAITFTFHPSFAPFLAMFTTPALQQSTTVDDIYLLVDSTSNGYAKAMAVVLVFCFAYFGSLVISVAAWRKLLRVAVGKQVDMEVDSVRESLVWTSRFAMRFAEDRCCAVLTNTLLKSAWLWVNGASVGRGAQIGTTEILEPELLVIGRGVVLGNKSTFASQRHFTRSDGRQMCRRVAITLRDHSFLGEAAYVAAESSTVETGVIVGPLTPAPESTAPWATYIGNPG